MDSSDLAQIPLSIPGRGAARNPTNRFEKLDIVTDVDAHDPEDPAPSTIFFNDTTRQIIATNDSPDVGFSASINPYRGCEHGCIYCYARPTHEYLGFSAGLDFETRIMVKQHAPELLRAALADPKWEPKTLQMSGVTDCYQPIERKLQLTRRCLAVLAEFRNPVSVISKNHLVTRDIELLSDLARDNAACVALTITTLDQDLTQIMEPRTSVPRRRLEAIAALTAAGVPAGVMVAPVIPGLTEHELPAILKAARGAGAIFAGYVPLRLPWGIAHLFEDWLGRYLPERMDKILNRIRALRGGKLNDPNFGSRMHGQGVWADQLKLMFTLAQRKAGLEQPFPGLSAAAFRRPPQAQLSFW